MIIFVFPYVSSQPLVLLHMCQASDMFYLYIVLATTFLLASGVYFLQLTFNLWGHKKGGRRRNAGTEVLVSKCWTCCIRKSRKKGKYQGNIQSQTRGYENLYRSAYGWIYFTSLYLKVDFLFLVSI